MDDCWREQREGKDGATASNGLAYSMRQLPGRNNTYVPIKIPTEDKVITVRDLI
jgi:hypothetical protein